MLLTTDTKYLIVNQNYRSEILRTIAKDYNDKRNIILNTSTQLFAEKGYDRASMRQIATFCNISKANLYHYFPSKNAILYSILARHLCQLKDYIISIPQKDRSHSEFLADVIEEILVFYRGNDDVHQLQINALGQLEEEDRKELIGYMRTLTRHVSTLIKNVNPEKFESKEKLRMATMSLFGMLNWYYNWNSGRGIKGRKEYARYVAQIMLHGVYSSSDDNAASPNLHEMTVE